MPNKIGILDPDGNNNNPLTNEPFSDNYKRLAKIWKSFPAYKNAEQIIDDIKENQVILVVSGTGSGKTVLLPKYVLHAYDYKGKIAVTLPKQIITKSSAEFSSQTLDVELGKQVGYKYKGSPKDMFGKSTNLLYATDGTIVRKLLNNPKLEEFDAVVIDEAHERKVQIDFLLFLLKRTIKLRPDFKLIIMSATINAEIFKDYFSDFKFKQLSLSGKTNYPIKSIYLKESIEREQYLEKGFEILKELLENLEINTDSSDVLFFVTSSNEAGELCKKLGTLDFKLNPICIEVYSGMNPKKEFLATDKDEFKKMGHKIKVVISTNVAESSLTIDGIKFVIDGGYEFLSEYDPIKRARILNMTRTTKAQIKQRMGRAGRTGPGTCYHLYTEKEFETFRDFPEPDIRKGNISSELLSLLNVKAISESNLSDVENLLEILKEMIEPPKKEYVKASLLDLSKIGLIKDHNLTRKGKLFSKISVSNIYSANCIFYSHFYKCSHEMSLIIGLLDACRNNIKNIFDVPKIVDDKRKEEYLKKKYREKKNRFNHRYGDHFAFLKIMTKYLDKVDTIHNKYKTKEKRIEKIRTWCYKHFLKYDTLKKARKYSIKIRKDMQRTFSKENIDVDFGVLKKLDGNIRCDEIARDVNDRLMLCLVLGFRTKKAKLDKNDTYSTKYVHNVGIGKESFLKDSYPRNIVFTELFIQGDSKELNIVTKIPNKFIK